MGWFGNNHKSWMKDQLWITWRCIYKEIFQDFQKSPSCGKRFYWRWNRKPVRRCSRRSQQKLVMETMSKRQFLMLRIQSWLAILSASMAAMIWECCCNFRFESWLRMWIKTVAKPVYKMEHQFIGFLLGCCYLLRRKACKKSKNCHVSRVKGKET